MKLNEKEIQEISQKVAVFISNYVLRRISTKHLYVLDVHVDLHYLNDLDKYVLDVFVYIDANPFCGVDVEKLINDAIEEGLRIAKEELRRWGIEEIKFEGED